MVGAGNREQGFRALRVPLVRGMAPPACVGVAVEASRRVTVGPGSGGGVPGREEPVLSVLLAGPLTSSRATQVLNPVEDEIRVGGPQDGAQVSAGEPEQGRLAVPHR